MLNELGYKTYEDAFDFGEIYKGIVNQYLLMTEHYNEKEKNFQYILSFIVNKYDIHVIAKLTQALTLLLYDQLIIDDECFYDETTRTFFFGTEAYQQLEAA